MGNVSGQDMSTLSKCMRRRYCQSIFPNYVSMELATACPTKAYGGRSLTCQGLESKGMALGFIVSVVLLRLISFCTFQLYPADKSHRMPIITPAYPSMCATHNVTDSTRTIMISEFKRAAECVDKIFIGAGQWPELFENHSFFQTYKYYLQVIASSDSAESQLKWYCHSIVCVIPYLSSLANDADIL